MCNENEQKVIFKVGNDIRILRGKLIREDETFIYIERRDGCHRINKSEIIKIEE